MNMGLYLELLIIATLYGVGIWLQFKPSSYYAIIYAESAFIICLIISIFGLLPAIMNAWQEYPHSLIELTSAAHIPLWGLFGVYLVTKTTNTKFSISIVSSLSGAIIGLNFLHQVNIVFLDYISSYSISSIHNYLLPYVIYIFPIMFSIGAVKSIPESRHITPWHFIFIYTFGFLILANLQNPDLTAKQNCIISIQQMPCGFVIFGLLHKLTHKVSQKI